MRAGSLSTVQQTLTPEAAAILNQSIAQAGHRNHGQTTSLHVAATLLASPSGYLRQACIRSHPNSSHPLQCRALELCFSVALDRLPATQNVSVTTTEPPISNALMAALKRAQAHQRRGCPEQQQQPLLAVKVELEQLIISILDDPSVSRVMREASFSSPAVKATIEQSLNNSNTSRQHQLQLVGGNLGFSGIGPPRVQLLSPATTDASPLPNRNIYLNPRLQQGVVTGLLRNQKDEDLKKVLEIMGRSKRKNPVLIGDSEPHLVVKELLRQITKNELENHSVLRNLQVLSLDKELFVDDNQILNKVTELEGSIESKIKSGGVILDMGDLKWLVEHPPGATSQVPEMGKIVVAEISKVFVKIGLNKLWLIGTATCDTYLRCQVHHPTMESDWDLQAIPIASKSSFTRLGTEKTVSIPMESLKASSPRIPFQTRHISENMDPTAERSNICSVCTENYEKELKKLAEIEKSFSESREEASSKQSLPLWLQSATFESKSLVKGKDMEILPNHKVQQLQKKWRDTCLHLHVDYHRNVSSEKIGSPSLSKMGLCSSNFLSCQPSQLKLQANKPLGEALQLNMSQIMNRPGSPVGTELVLGRKSSINEHENRNEDHTADFLGCISSELETKRLDKFANDMDADTYKKLHKELMEKAWWQPEAASSVASVITRFRLGQRGGSRGDVWILLTGPERVGKKKMASVVSEQICGSSPIVICLGKRRDDEEREGTVRGKTAIDRIAEAVRRNPFSVIMLEDIDEADMLVRGSIKRAIDRGRLVDSHGREVGLGNSIVIVTGDWSSLDTEAVREGYYVDEKRLATLAGGSWQLGLILRDKVAKRRMSSIFDEDEDRPLKIRRETGSRTGTSISLDLNLATGSCTEDEKTDGSINSSEVTIDQDDEPKPPQPNFLITSVPQDLASNIDEMIVFKPVESSLIRREIRKRISTKFTSIVDDNLLIEIGDDVLEKILGGVWHDRTSLDEWIETVLKPSFEQLKVRIQPVSERRRWVVRLVVESDSCNRGKMKENADWLPKSILV